jgi:hypothetical protein
MQIELPLDHEPSLDHWARSLADDDVETGEILNWDHAYESAWWYIEQETAQ